MSAPPAIETHPDVTFGIGPIRLLIRGATPSAGADLVERMDPLSADGSGDPAADVVVSFVDEAPPASSEIHNPARDGIVTAVAASTRCLLARGDWCTVPDPWSEAPVVVTCSRRFPLRRLLHTVVHPTLQLGMLGRGACSVHASAVIIDGAGILIAGWSESGKTETALALAERGAAFLSDKWTTLRAADGAMGAFPISVGIRRWVLEFLPHLRSRIPFRARTQLTAAGIAGRAAAPFVDRATGPVTTLAAGMVERAVALGDRASLRQSTLREIYGGPPRDRDTPLRLLVLLQTTSGGIVVGEERDPAFAAARLARSASYERRDYLSLGERWRYAAPGDQTDVHRASEAKEAALLRDALSDVRIVNVRTPFPVDPRRVADVVDRWR